MPIFLCDEMLKGLGRWLRVAGYDTLILEDGCDDTSLLRRALADGRLLLTRDRSLLDYRQAPGTVILLHGNGVAQCAEELSRLLGIDWQYRPFSRCTRCNTPLREASRGQRQQAYPDIGEDEPLLYCPRCDQLYWQGSHVRRMRSTLRRWSEGDFSPD